MRKKTTIWLFLIIFFLPINHFFSENQVSGNFLTKKDVNKGITDKNSITRKYYLNKAKNSNMITESYFQLGDAKIKNIILSDRIFEMVIVFLLFSSLYKNYRKNRYGKNLITTEYQKIPSKELVQEKDDNYTSKTTENQKTKLISDIKELEILENLKVFEKGTNFMNKNFTLSTLAFFLKTNTKYTTHILKLHRNKSFNDYINGLKIQYIIKLMNEDSKYLNYKIIYLAEICGFSTHSRFSHIFKNEIGIAPSQFISELKNKNNTLKQL